MSVIADTWRQLVRRRLWPLAILLVAALVAVPLLLAKEPETEAPAALPAGLGAAKGETELATEPIVEIAAEADRPEKARVLGKAHDIFKPTKKAEKVKAEKSDDAGPDTPKDADTDSGEDTDTSSGGGGGPSSPVPSTPPADPAPAPKTYPLYSLQVRFSADGQSVKGYLPRRTALPSRAEPLLIYLGLLDDKKTAVFMVDSTVRAVGDGECHPTPENCETVRMQVGDTMFFDVVDETGNTTAQFELDLLKINKKQTTDAAKAAKSASLAKVASASQVRAGVATGLGRESLRRLGVVGRTG